MFTLAEAGLAVSKPDASGDIGRLPVEIVRGMLKGAGVADAAVILPSMGDITADVSNSDEAAVRAGLNEAACRLPSLPEAAGDGYPDGGSEVLDGVSVPSPRFTSILDLKFGSSPIVSSGGSVLSCSHASSSAAYKCENSEGGSGH